MPFYPLWFSVVKIRKKSKNDGFDIFHIFTLEKGTQWLTS